jgi:hypothetical protein
VLASQLADITADVTWSCQPRFDADEPFRRVPRASLGARVWVDLSAVDEVRLTLENERENRFFLRRLPLSGGLNELGRDGGLTHFASIGHWL